MSVVPQADAAEGDAVFVVVEKGVGAPLALDHRAQAAEQTHVLSRFDDEGALAFARRVIARLRRVRRAGLKIRSVAYVVPDGVSVHARRKNRLLNTLVRALEPGARVTLVASYLSAASALGWSSSARAARPEVTCDIVWQGSSVAAGSEESG
ncbi:MAG: hypothetical protein QM756_07260 [Polyangiaceae bacterium]